MPKWFEVQPNETYTQWLKRVNEGNVEDVTADEAARINAAWRLLN